MKKKNLGFSLLELSIGLVITGIIVTTGLPLSQLYVNHYKHAKDTVTINQLNKLIVGYAMSRGGFPDSAAGDVIPTINIGMTGINSYNDDLQYYVNALLTETVTTGNFTTLCDTAINILDGTTASTEPAICNDVSGSFVDCTDSTVMAFVLVSPGKDLTMNHENNDGDQDYENPTKKTTVKNDYDDLVVSFGIPELVYECQKI